MTKEEAEQIMMKTRQTLLMITFEETKLHNHDLQKFMKFFIFFIALQFKFQHFIALFTTFGFFFWVHQVPRRLCYDKLVEGIKNQLGYINTNMLHETINQLAFRQSQIRVMITQKKVTQEKGHPNLSDCGHMCSHGPQLLSHHATNEVRALKAKQMTYSFFLKTCSPFSP